MIAAVQALLIGHGGEQLFGLDVEAEHVEGFDTLAVTVHGTTWLGHTTTSSPVGKSSRSVRAASRALPEPVVGHVEPGPTFHLHLPPPHDVGRRGSAAGGLTVLGTGLHGNTTRRTAV